jgi:hypothetical protein
VINYVPPVDEMFKVMDATEIHMRYGLEMLQTNLGSINWIKARPCSPTSATYQSLNRIDSNRWSDQMESLDETLATQVTSVSTAPVDSDAESNFSNYITDLLDETELQKMENDDVSPETTTPTMASTFASAVRSATIGESLNDGSTSITDERTTSIVLDNLKPSTHQKQDIDPSRQDRNHLIGDLVLMAKTAFNLHANQRDWIKVSSLKDSIMYESDLRGQLGAKYNPSKDTNLDGNKALAKEIIATHSSDEIQQWESGECTFHESCCLLNCKFLSLDRDNDDSRLGEEIVNSFQLITQIQSYNKCYIPAVVDAVRFELSKDKHPSTFDWMKNRAKFLETKEKKVSRTSTPSDAGRGKRTSTKKLEPYPATDSRLIDFINSHLQVFVNKSINQARDEVPQMNGEIKVEKFFFKLASEFLRRNKGWQNENSFTTPQHLTKVEEFTNLKSRPSEAALTFSILKRVIDDFRTAFKQRYPKVQAS